MGSLNSRLKQLRELGQSAWLDYIRRGLLEDGSLERMIREWRLGGVTSNPSIFEQAIGRSDDYDDAFEALARDGEDANAIYEALAFEDIRRTADLFREVYDGADGRDGLVSLEVSPELAYDTERTLEEARRLWREVDRPNLMVKVPGTEAGVPAIEELIAEGVNVNVTLLFSLDGHERVMEAYLRGLERRREAGGDLSHVASVASFFVSRVDSAVDAELDRVAEAGDERAEEARRLRGRIAIANARLAYARFREIFGSDRFAALEREGAQLQRPLWASTSTKDPAYRDVIYVEELIGPDTVNTLPLDTLKAFADHGEAKRTVDLDVGDARADIAALAELGIDLAEVTHRLEKEGVEKFADSFRAMLEAIEEKRSRITAGV
jgi:transaldolase